MGPLCLFTHQGPWNPNHVENYNGIAQSQGHGTLNLHDSRGVSDKRLKY